MFGGIPAFGGHSLSGSIERSATLTAKDSRLDIESETFFVAPTLAGGGRKSGGYSLDDIPITAPALRAQAQSSHRADSEAFIVAGTLNANGKAAGSATQQDAESGLLVVHGTQDPGYSSHTAFALGRNSGQENAVCVTGDITHTLKADGFDGSEDGTGRGQPITAASSGVRRLTPTECERLQGFPDDYTQIPWRNKPAGECPDGPRYKAIGNSKAVPVVRWIGKRLLAALQMEH
jgi:DNA (cytosine-5)-methyltransferase 1